MWRFIFALVANALKNSSTSSVGKAPMAPCWVEGDVEDEGRSAGEVDGDLGEGFVHGDDGPAVAVDAALVGEGFFECLPQDDADVLDGVVCVDVEAIGSV
jgi:hypothetical protein